MSNNPSSNNHGSVRKGQKRKLQSGAAYSKIEQYGLPSTSTEGQPFKQFTGSCKSLKYTPADDEADMVMEVSAGDLGLPSTEAGRTTSSVASATRRSKKLLNLSIEVQEDNPEEILGLEHLILELPDQQLLESSSKDNFDKGNEEQDQIRQVEDQNVDTDESDVADEDDEDVVEEDDEDEADDDYEDDSAASDEEDEEDEEDAAVGTSTITALSANQAELVDRLMNDSISFSELTAMMGDGGEGDLLPADDMAASSHAAATTVAAAAASETPEAVVEEPCDAGSIAEQDKRPSMDSAEQFEQELCQQQRSRRRGRGRGQRLHPTIKALMGQANICMAHNDTNEAIKMCLEVIRQFPTSPLPYETLGLIYQNRGLENKFLQFQLMAAFLSPVAQKWVDLAVYYEDQDELDQAVYCYSRAIRLSPSELSLHWSRVELLERMGQQARALNCYSYMIKFLKPDQAEAGLKLAKDIAKIHFSQQNYGGARKALEAALLRYPSHVTHEDINLLLDVLLTMKDYSAGLGALISYAGVSLLPKEDFPESDFSALAVCDQLLQSRACHLPADLPIDLRSKLTVCLVMTRAFSVAQPLLHALMLEPTEQFGDLYLDAAEALLSAEAPTRALPLLRRMLDCPHHRTSSVAWRLYAEALVAESGPTEEAVQAYYRVVEYAPDNASARLTLADLLQSRGSNDEALIAMGQDLRSPYDCQVLQRKCELLLERGMLDEFVLTVTLLLGRHFVNIRSRDEAEVLINNKKASNKFEALRERRRSKSEPVEDSEAQYCGAEVPLLHQWRLFVRACRILFSQKRYAELEHLTYGALGCRDFMKEHNREVEFFCLQASMANNNSYFAFNLVRDIVVRYPDNCRVWNLLNQVIIRADDFRHNRFLLRLSQKQPNNLALSMLNAHNCLVAGTYKYSLAEYMKVFKGRQTDPLASLMLGLTYVHMACQKFSADKNTLVTQAWVFLNSYRELRGDCQESMYNIGRAMHQLNVLHQAIHYYELALQCPRPVQRPGEPSFDLTCEIAFNLSLLYRKGSPKLSRYYIRKYITV